MPRRPVLGWAVGGCALILALVVVPAIFLLTNPLENLSQNTEVPINLMETPLIQESPTPSTGVHATEPPLVGTLSALPTVRYPDGNLFKLLYDDNSFYLLNLSNNSVPVNWIAFERLSYEGLPLNRFNGTRWAEFYSSSLPGRCMALRILGSPSYLDPPECGDNNFLSLRTPVRDDETVFWTTQEGSELFRILWREGGVDEEIARCEITAGTCEVFLP